MPKLFTTLEPPKYLNSNSSNLCFDFSMILRQTIWGALEKNIWLGFRKGCVNPEGLKRSSKKIIIKDLDNLKLNILQVPLSRTSYMFMEKRATICWVSTTTVKKKSNAQLIFSSYRAKYLILCWYGHNIWKVSRIQ